MAIDVFKEQVVAISQAARGLPRLRNNRPVHPATIWRWATVGLRGIRLETVRLGGRNVTSIEALQRFFASLNDKPLPDKSLDKQQQEVERALEAMGI